LTIEYRWAEGHYDRLPALAAELVGRKVDLIATRGGYVAALATKTATSTIPIVFGGGGGPVEEGVVPSLAQPGGNLTGASFLAVELVSKRVELLSELAPQAGVIALLVNPNFSGAERVIRDAQEAVRVMGRQLAILKASSESEIDAAFATLVQLRAGALVIAGDAFFSSRREQLVALAVRHAVPAIYSTREFTASGDQLWTEHRGCLSPGRHLRRKDLKGEKPADLPVQQSTRFELVINLQTAKALGLTVPQTLLARADEVIE
jgi:putative ABC transport system substrate-binding protein